MSFPSVVWSRPAPPRDPFAALVDTSDGFGPEPIAQPDDLSYAFAPARSERRISDDATLRDDAPIRISEEQIYENLRTLSRGDRTRPNVWDGVRGALLGVYGRVSRGISRLLDPPDEGVYFYGIREDSPSLRERLRSLRGRLDPGGEYGSGVAAPAVVSWPLVQEPRERVSDPSGSALTGIESLLIGDADVERAGLYGVPLTGIESLLIGDADVPDARVDETRAYSSIAAGYVEQTLAGRTLNKSAMRAVEAKSKRLKRFARIYAETGDVGQAAESVGITSDRTIADYVARTENAGYAPDKKAE